MWLLQVGSYTFKILSFLPCFFFKVQREKKKLFQLSFCDGSMYSSTYHHRKWINIKLIIPFLDVTLHFFIYFLPFIMFPTCRLTTHWGVSLEGRLHCCFILHTRVRMTETRGRWKNVSKRMYSFIMEFLKLFRCCQKHVIFRILVYPEVGSLFTYKYPVECQNETGLAFK